MVEVYGDGLMTLHLGNSQTSICWAAEQGISQEWGSGNGYSWMAANARWKFASQLDFESYASVEQVYQCAEENSDNSWEN